MIAEILDIGKIEDDVYKIDLGNGNFVWGGYSDKKQIFREMRLKCEIGIENK